MDTDIELTDEFLNMMLPFRSTILLLNNNRETMEEVKDIVKRLKQYIDENDRPHDYNYYKEDIELIFSIIAERYSTEEYPELWI